MKEGNFEANLKRADEIYEKKHDEDLFPNDPPKTADLRKLSENIKPRRETIAKEEIQKAIEVKKFLERFRQDHPCTPESVEELEEILDTMPLWKFKFSTMPRSRQRQKLECDPALDSDYYVTPAGISLRLRKFSLYPNRNNWQTVIMELKEKMTCGLGTQKSLKPTIGFFVYEYSTPEFQTLLEAGRVDQDYTSLLPVYRKGDQLLWVDSPDSHHGDRINKIFFEK